VELVARVGSDDPQAWWDASVAAKGIPPQVVNGRPRYALEGIGILSSVFRAGESIRVVHMDEVDAEVAVPELRALGDTFACLPLVVSGKLVGGLYLFWKDEREPTENEKALAATLAGLCGQALARARLFTAERDAKKRAVASEEKLKSMAFDHVLREDAERRRMAATLHDGLGQYLALAKMTLDPLRQRVEGSDRTVLDSAIGLLDKSIEETRSLSFELSPPILYDLGIGAALSWLGEKLEAEVGLHVEVIHDGPEPPVDEITASIAFRAARELLMNVVKHTDGMKAQVTIRQTPTELTVIVDDEGDGFDPSDPSPSGFGLMSIREEIGRLGGTVAITSSRAGTRAAIHVPMRPKPSSDE
jgi:signal transduction histidine kinase